MREARKKRVGDGEVPPAASFDIVCFAVFDWSFRYQRPQHLMAELGRRGHRVFHLTPVQTSSRRIAIRRVAPNVWEVELPHESKLDRFAANWTTAQREQLADGIAAMRRECDVACAIAVVQMPSWADVAATAHSRFGWPLIYDCMDDWREFASVDPSVIEAEQRLVREAAAMTVSSETLRKRWRAAALLPNACDYEFFATPKGSPLLENIKRPVIGYYGAIEEWFDARLMRDVITSRPDYTFVLIGHVRNSEAADLARLPNVRLPGEKPYDLMPEYLHAFDVCLVPFIITPLTIASDVVKLYEYFAQGKPVVATALPEVARHQPLVTIAQDAGAYAAAIDRALSEDDASLRTRRMEVAGANTWRERGKVLEELCRSVSPLASIVIVTYNNLDYTRLCLGSVLANTHSPRFEVIVVDNASSDGTREYLQNASGVRVVFNERNEGFARANNQGIAVASGQRIVLLNNDTVVPRGWSCRLLRHLDDPEIGLAVSTASFSGNESRVEVDYRDLDGMQGFASRRAAAHDGERFDIPVAAMYCVAMRREVYERVGPLDERFTIGMFEDDDYSKRVRDAGYRVVCAEDAFVHHYGEASFKKLSRSDYSELFERNKRLFEEKWGAAWVPHRDRSGSPG